MQGRMRRPELLGDHVKIASAQNRESTSIWKTSVFDLLLYVSEHVPYGVLDSVNQAATKVSMPNYGGTYSSDLWIDLRIIIT